jgi:putative transposase
MRIRQLNHSVYQVLYHLVWGTKYRRKILKHYVRAELIKSLYNVQKRHPDWYFHKINTGDDHVHILLEIPPFYSLAAVAQELKSLSCSHLRKKFKFINEIYSHSGIWSVGYFVSTVGLNEDNIRKYIERQNNFDTGVDITEEIASPSSHE